MHKNDLVKAVQAASDLIEGGEITGLHIQESGWLADITLDTPFESFNLQVYFYKEREWIVRYQRPFDSIVFSMSCSSPDAVREGWPLLLNYADTVSRCDGEKQIHHFEPIASSL